MTDYTRFGPAGVPERFKKIIGHISDVPDLLHAEGLTAFEYPAVRWGQKPQIKKESAEQLKNQALKNDIVLSIHGSYFLNLCGKEEIVEASKRRILACVQAAKWMNAYVVVFHPGFYGKMDKNAAQKKCVKELREVVETMKSLGITEVKLGPETMGKISQVGSLEEILTFCEEVEQTHLVIDWGHLHARHNGFLRESGDFRSIINNIEQRLGTKAVRNMHCHFSKIEYTKKGERRHHILDNKDYGPDFKLLSEVIVEYKMNPVIISETPLLDLDSINMRNMLNNMMNS
ncbi:TIM barrel protein [Candidatus Bathyarchaeota archaeon]|nr:TIM barrel protein [Candidatus Bathyarchaeota archaeon]